MRYFLSIFLTVILFGSSTAPVRPNPVLEPVIVTEFSTDDDWIEIYCFSQSLHLFTLTVSGSPVEINLDIPPEHGLTWIVLDQSNTSGFDLAADQGSIVFTGSPLDKPVWYGTAGPVPAPPEGESAAVYITEGLYTSSWGLDESPTPGEMNDIPPTAYGGSNVCINEVRPGDSASGDEPFVELYNTGDSPVDIGGWSIVADERYHIPAGTIIGAGGFVVCDAACFGGAFRLSSEAGVICLQSGDGVMFEKTGWSGVVHAGNVLARIPDGFTTVFIAYDDDSALDFRESSPTPGAPNEALYPLTAVVIENDSLVVRPGTEHQYYCDGIDTNGSRFRVTPEWRTEGDVASIDNEGLLTGINAGNGMVIAEIGGLSAATPVFGALPRTVQQDLVLDAGSSPYWIYELNIKEGATLTIEPGVTLFIEWGGGLVSRGTVRAIGKAGTPIRFLPVPGSAGIFDGEGQYMGSWNGIMAHGGGNVFSECRIEHAGTGILVDHPYSGTNGSRTLISGCMFKDNAVALSIRDAAYVTNCLVTGTGMGREGISVDDDSGDVSIINNTIYNMSWIGASIGQGVPSIINNCIDSCRNGIYFNGVFDANVKYNNIYASDTPFFQGSDEFGDITGMNRNGTPCDMFGNIIADPLFVDPSSNDYRLRQGSPCIDAGDPDILDDDGSISDIGYLGGSNTVSVASAGTPTAVVLRPNHPNPFNPSTVISFVIPEACRVALEIFSLSGQRVSLLADEVMPAGDYMIRWQAAPGLAAGLYLCRLRAGVEVRTMKMLYLK